MHLESRTVANDNTVRYGNRILQIPAQNHRCQYVRTQVCIQEYPEAALAVYHGSRCLARYSMTGELLKAKTKQADLIRWAALPIQRTIHVL